MLCLPSYAPCDSGERSNKAAFAVGTGKVTRLDKPLRPAVRSASGRTGGGQRRFAPHAANPVLRRAPRDVW